MISNSPLFAAIPGGVPNGDVIRVLEDFVHVIAELPRDESLDCYFDREGSRAREGCADESDVVLQFCLLAYSSSFRAAVALWTKVSS